MTSPYVIYRAMHVESHNISKQENSKDWTAIKMHRMAMKFSCGIEWTKFFQLFFYTRLRRRMVTTTITSDKFSTHLRRTISPISIDWNMFWDVQKEQRSFAHVANVWTAVPTWHARAKNMAIRKIGKIFGWIKFYFSKFDAFEKTTV